MPDGRNSFVDPKTNVEYVWARNHETEEASGKAREITGTANTGLTGRVRQQGDDGSLVLKLGGRITHRDMLVQFWHWYALSRTQTIYFRDFDGDEYEVQITSFQPKRVRKLRAVSPDPAMQTYYVEYTLEMEVYGIRAGVLATAEVTP